MCGRLNMATDPHDIVGELGIDVVDYTFAPRYNVPPGAALPIVAERVEDTGEVIRRLETARWGLVPGWAKEEKIGFKAFNARGETVHEKPMFRHAFASQRCIIPVTGYYEWEKTETGKQPWLMQAQTERPLYMAGLFEFRRRPDLDGQVVTDPAIKNGWLVSTTIITCPSTGHLADVHDRMPVMAEPEALGDWLDPSHEREGARTVLDGLIAGFDPASVGRVKVGAAVGNVRNQDPEVAQPVE
ncbi:SOS response-associated peptidase [Brevibacterium luteolum]|uniref:Abasic site processing protein n=1 Tax=Brevibacterium luteolum TaxID=199591 RepID=A0A849ASQ4_9MICO|nr:SOS response-associated peptidase [Brevibacterium luteolum]NNG79683.1 SOS response-associated peptidase [Brevibacterium luteolum]